MPDPKPKPRYQPQFHHESPLPAVQKFQLNYILREELASESQQVVDSLLAVTSSYRADLKTEIRNKLSIEQKLQFKNIDVAKSTHLLEKAIHQENKRLAKVLSGARPDGPVDRNNCVDEEVLALVDLTESLSEKTQALARKLAKIDAVVHKSKDVGHLSKYPLVHRYLTRKPGQTEGPKVEPRKAPVAIAPVVAPVTIAKPPPEPVKPVESPSKHMFKPIDEEIDPKDFEAFMATTLTKYRKLQLEKHNLDIFLTPDDPGQLDNMDLFNSPEYDNSLTSSYHTSENPISLLYTKPSIKSLNETSVKSPAIVTQNLQTSHFKKLRINGAPITSETFMKQRSDSCECNSQDLLAKVKLDLESDAFDSSGLNTDSDDQEVLLSSHSSGDSSGSDTEITGVASEYFQTLKKDLKLKKRQGRKRTARIRELSPTPKHQPSHYTLKPKRSILKISQAPPRTVHRRPSKKMPRAKQEPSGAKKVDANIEQVTASGIILPSEITDSESAFSEYEDHEIRRWDGVHEADERIKSLSKLRTFVS